MESMGKYKIKVVGIVIFVTLAVYILIKYMLPLALPFVIALIIAVLIDKPVTFITRKLHFKRIFSILIVLVVLLAVIGILIYWLVSTLVTQLGRFMTNFDVYMGEMQQILCNGCTMIDGWFGLSDGSSLEYMNRQIDAASSEFSDSVIPKLMDGSINAAGTFAVVFTALAFAIMAIVFFSRDMEKMKALQKESIFNKEIKFITSKLGDIFGTYVKTQGIIMLITAVICTLGLYAMGNDYALLAGVLIGIMDALPVLGTGTVFIPWSIILLLLGKYQRAVMIFGIYILCYYIRQFLEPRLMGTRMGISPVIMMLSLYAGLILFGISGVITGPIAAVLIKEISGQIIKNL